MRENGSTGELLRSRKFEAVRDVGSHTANAESVCLDLACSSAFSGSASCSGRTRQNCPNAPSPAIRAVAAAPELEAIWKIAERLARFRLPWRAISRVFPPRRARAPPMRAVFHSHASIHFVVHRRLPQRARLRLVFRVGASPLYHAPAARLAALSF